MLRIFLAHDLPVPVDERLHPVAFAHQLVPVHRIELEGIAVALNPVLGLAAAKVRGIVVERPSINGAKLSFPFAGDLLEESSSPRPVVPVGAGTNKRQFLSESRHPGRETTKL